MNFNRSAGIVFYKMCANIEPFANQHDIANKETPLLPNNFKDLDYLLKG